MLKKCPKIDDLAQDRFGGDVFLLELPLGKSRFYRRCRAPFLSRVPSGRS
jgi:hypothetical protein